MDRKRLSRRVGALLLASFLPCLAATAARAEDYTLRDGGPSENEMLAHGKFEGLEFFRPVLSGVLYRAGFKGGDKERDGLSSAQREALCQAGFTEAVYIDFGKNTHYGETSCARGTLDYEQAKSSDVAAVMTSIYEVIKHPDRGPVLVHCMWGVHSSGAVAAMALVQFCGWSQERAISYWNNARNNADCSGGCSNWIAERFSHFHVNPALQISDAERAAICPE